MCSHLVYPNRLPDRPPMGVRAALRWLDVAIEPPSTCRRCGWLAPEVARYCGNCGLRLRSAEHVGAFSRAMCRGRLLRDWGRPWCGLAVRSFRRAAQICPTAVDPLLELARTYRLMQRPVTALRWYRRALRQQPDAPSAWLEACACCGPYAHFRKARWLAQALASRPGHPAIISELRRQLCRLGGWQRWWVERAVWRAQLGRPLAAG